MPFLIFPVKFFLWHKKRKSCHMYAFCILLIILFIFFIFSNYISYGITEFSDEQDHFNKTLQDPFVNFIYRIDIEFVVFFVQWASFYILMKVNSIAIEFFGHINWIILYRSYFSFILTINTVLLFIFYHDETLMEINTITILIYSLVGAGGTFLFMILFYIFYELPYKRLIKLIYKRHYEKKEKNEIIEEDKVDEEEIDKSDIDDIREKIKNE